MNIKYLTDDNGQSTGVFIPISEWNELKSRFKDLECDLTINDVHRQILDSRITSYKEDPSIALDFDEVMFRLKH